MKYYVCIQNCFEDYYYENAASIGFDEERTAIAYVEGLQRKMEHTFDLAGDIRSYFSGEEYEEFYQLIDIVPCDRYVENMDCYTHIPDSVYMVSKHYTMNIHGDIQFFDWKRINPESI